MMRLAPILGPQHREHHGRWHRRGIARRAFRGATPLNSGSRLAATGGTWLEEGSDFLSDQQCWYECAAAWHIPGRDPAQQPGAPAQHSSSATGRLAAVIRASPAAADEGYTDMEGLSDQEEWVFGSCCEAAACWCSELDAWSCQEPAAAPAAPAGPAAHATDGEQSALFVEPFSPCQVHGGVHARHAAPLLRPASPCSSAHPCPLPALRWRLQALPPATRGGHWSRWSGVCLTLAAAQHLPPSPRTTPRATGWPACPRRSSCE